MALTLLGDAPLTDVASSIADSLGTSSLTLHVVQSPVCTAPTVAHPPSAPDCPAETQVDCGEMCEAIQQLQTQCAECVVEADGDAEIARVFTRELPRLSTVSSKHPSLMPAFDLIVERLGQAPRPSREQDLAARCQQLGELLSSPTYVPDVDT